MLSLMRVTRELGVSTLLRLKKAREWAWEDLISPHFVTRSIQTLLNVGLLEEMKDHPVDISKFAAKHNLDLEILTGLCEALYERRILLRADGCYSLDEKGRFFVETKMARGWFDLAYGYEKVLFNLEPLLRKEMQYGKDIVRDGKYVGVGSGLASYDFYFPLVCETIRRGSYRKVLDIGCGDGTFLRYLCSQIDGIEGVGLDLSPEAVQAGNETLVQEGLSDRIKLHVGDAMEIANHKDALKGVDAATVFFVLHELCDRQANPRARKFLEVYRATLPGAPFHIIETVRPTPEEMREKPGPGVEYFLFHDLSGQKPIGREEWKGLFTSSGYQNVVEDYIDFARTSIYTLR